ncbi:MAG: hypothetical protein PWP41_1907 [Moorella sp. (in: firmicutes)]|nr:hypothetical protein [Moorella sp. (in: firmicutes)]
MIPMIYVFSGWLRQKGENWYPSSEAASTQRARIMFVIGLLFRGS